MKTIIHVNQQVIKSNLKTGSNDPALIVRNYKGRILARQVVVDGQVVFHQSMKHPLDCGARVWAVTNDKVEVLT